MKNNGFVSLVGAGPGDADLLTIKAHRLLGEADVILYDRLVSGEIMSLIPSGISRIAVGKVPGAHCVPQEQINDILVSLAKTGRHVVRLKGGDPYLFGRGGEEIGVLKRHGIPFEVVPGITAASGCSAYAGIPLTHRGMSRRVQFLTGHFRDDEPLDIDWNRVADPDSTLVIYMGLSSLGLICDSLVAAGLPADTPAAVIENGTTPGQHRLLARLDSLVDSVREQQIEAPAMIIIGRVVALAKELDWFQSALEQREPESRVERVENTPYEIHAVHQ